MMPPPGLTGPAMRPPGSKAHQMASQIEAVIPSRVVRRVAAIDDEGRGLAAAIMRDRPVVIQNSFADGHVVLRVLILTA
jgi:hypothetical protein